MSEAKHTPGPWWPTDYGVRDSGGFICATTWPSRYPGQEERYAQETAQRQADARLIAAAPELLEALQYAMPYLQACVPCPRNGVNADCTPDVNCVDRALAAIAKATGAAP